MQRTQTPVPASPAGRAGQQRPVIVLAYAYSGAAPIQRLLSGSAVLACTSGTGLLPLCDQAAAAWRRVDNRAGPLSSLAASSIRALAGGMISVLLAEAGKPRWCEISSSPPATAETFLQLYPGTRFVCLHRSCPDVIRAGIEANPWGLTGTGFAPFAVAYPGSSAAAIAAYWADRTEPLLRFQQAHPAACRTVRYDDLAGYPERQARDIAAFLDLDAAPSPTGPDVTLTREEAPPAAADGGALAGAELPAGHLPPPLLDRVNDLQARLGFPPIRTAS
jgi:hypothetical protein